MEMVTRGLRPPPPPTHTYYFITDRLKIVLPLLLIIILIVRLSGRPRLIVRYFRIVWWPAVGEKNCPLSFRVPSLTVYVTYHFILF